MDHGQVTGNGSSIDSPATARFCGQVTECQTSFLQGGITMRTQPSRGVTTPGVRSVKQHAVYTCRKATCLGPGSNVRGEVCLTPQAKLLKEQLEVVKYRDADTGALRYSIRPVEGQLTFDKVQLRICVRRGRRLSAVLLAPALTDCSAS